MAQGGDPEFHIVDRKTKKAISSHELPKTIFRLYNHMGHSGKNLLKRDGSAVELEWGPSTCRDYYIPHMQTTFVQLQNLLNENGFPYKDWKISTLATVELSDDTLSSAPKDVLMFGCQPEENIYRGTLSPDCPVGHKYRYNGGHLHLDIARGTKYGIDYESKIEDYVRGLDLMVAVPLVALMGSSQREYELARREFYGMAGSYRNKSYGIEYRTLSSRACIGHPVLMAAVLGTARDVVKILKHCDLFTGEVDAQSIIDNHDVKAAKAALNLYRRILGEYGNQLLTIYDMVTYGKFNFVDDLAFNWQAAEGKISQNHHWMGSARAINRPVGMMPNPKKKVVAKSPRPMGSPYILGHTKTTERIAMKEKV